jgi:hypothetical protein
MNSTVLTAPTPRAVVSRPIQTAGAKFTQQAVYVYLVIQFVSQSALMIEDLGSYRTVLRALGYASSLFLLVLFSGLPERRSPLRAVAIAFLAVVCLGLANPHSNTALATLGQIAINIAIWGPVLWCSRVKGSPEFMRKVLLLFWGFNVAGSIMGVLQVYYPERFSPSPEFVKQLVGIYADGLLINLADGTQVYRPMGLSDSPGGASVAGSFAVILGLALVATERNWFLAIIAIAGAAAGMFCVYICETRSVLLMTILGAAVYLVMMGVRQRLSRMALLICCGTVILLGCFYWAFSVSSVHMSNRFETLTDQPFGTVYYKNRGHFVESTLTELLPQYPLGAGLGRWGMMSSYFGDPNLPDSAPIWAEIQLTGWLLDGGLPLVVLGYLALLLACFFSARLAIYSRDPRIADLAAVMTSFNLSIVMVTFNYPVFISQMGMMFWVLNGLLHASALARRPPPAAVQFRYA